MDLDYKLNVTDGIALRLYLRKRACVPDTDI